MLMNIDVTPEQEKAICNEAGKEGVTLQEYALKRLLPHQAFPIDLLDELPDDLKAKVNDVLSAPTKPEALERFVKAFADHDAPAIPLEDLTRERMYSRDEG
jgi:hypothetical protein